MYCSVGLIAKLFNLSERRIQQLVKEKIIPKSVKGKYHLADSVCSYVRHLQDKSASPKASSIDIEEEKAELVRSKSKKAKLELQLLEGKYLDKKEVDFTWQNLALHFRSRMLAIPTKLAPLIVTSCSDQQYSAGCHKVQDILESEIHQALLELSKTTYEDIDPDKISSDEAADTLK